MAELILVFTAEKIKSSCLFTDCLRHCRKIGSSIKSWKIESKTKASLIYNIFFAIGNTILWYGRTNSA